MSGYTLSSTLDPNRVFILHRSDLEKRFDPFYYIPELVEFENKVLSKIPLPLRYSVISIASGATPKTTESELYYTDKENGVPFLRVQNLSATGILEFDDCKYINYETHNGPLKRSQVFENDLLVKITGVGRMAVASVAPKDFEGNINQHVCVIKTKSREVSEIIAAFLNSDIGEKLASRRSTGGTRPALDYPALLSIPIIHNKRVLEITQKVVEQKKQNEDESERLLASIDDYLLRELGIEPVKIPENNLGNRMFISTIKEVSGNRIDPAYHQIYFQKLIESIKISKYKCCKLGDEIHEINYGASFKNDYVASGVPLLRIKDLRRNEIVIDKVVYLPESARDIIGNCFVKTNDFLISRSGTIGVVSIVPKEIDGFAFGSFMIKFNLKKESKLNREFLSYYLNSKLLIELIERDKIGAIQGNITIPIIKSFLVPIPPLEKQKEIAEHITEIRRQAQELKERTKEALERANKKIEEILLN